MAQKAFSDALGISCAAGKTVSHRFPDGLFLCTGDRQAKKTPAKNLDDLRSPLRYLLGKTRLEKELDGLSLAPDLTPLQAGDVVMRGLDRKSTRLNSSHIPLSRMPSS